MLLAGCAEGRNFECSLKWRPQNRISYFLPDIILGEGYPFTNCETVLLKKKIVCIKRNKFCLLINTCSMHAMDYAQHRAVLWILRSECHVTTSFHLILQPKVEVSSCLSY